MLWADAMVTVAGMKWLAAVGVLAMVGCSDVATGVAEFENIVQPRCGWEEFIVETIEKTEGMCMMVYTKEGAVSAEEISPCEARKNADLYTCAVGDLVHFYAPSGTEAALIERTHAEHIAGECPLRCSSEGDSSAGAALLDITQ